MSLFNFDAIIDRRALDSEKWRFYPADVLPMWVADMDFASPPEVTAALQAHLATGSFGYGEARPQAAIAAVQQRLLREYQWQVDEESILFLPGLVCGLNIAARAVGNPGDAVLTSTPVYPPFMSAPLNQQRELQTVPLIKTLTGNEETYSIDFAALEQAVTAKTRLYILCNPHNPVGCIFDRTELQQLFEFAEKHDLIICSDEIHNELLLDQHRHLPFATLHPEAAQRTITILAPSKTFNIAGLGASVAIIENPALRKQFEQAKAGIVPQPGTLALTALQAAYDHGDPWLHELRAYLTANRNLLIQELQGTGVTITHPEATYLMWINCQQTAIGDQPAEQLLKAGLALNDGVNFGTQCGKGYVRLNFGCTRATLLEGIRRLKSAL